MRGAANHLFLSLVIFFAAAIVAAAIAKFLLHLDFASSTEHPGYDSASCYENWAAHRACPQGLPPVTQPLARTRAEHVPSHSNVKPHDGLEDIKGKLTKVH